MYSRHCRITAQSSSAPGKCSVLTGNFVKMTLTGSERLESFASPLFCKVSRARDPDVLNVWIPASFSPLSSPPLLGGKNHPSAIVVQLLVSVRTPSRDSCCSVCRDHFLV